MTEAAVRSNRKLTEDFHIFMGKKCLVEDALRQRVSELKAEVRSCKECEGRLLVEAEHHQEAGHRTSADLAGARLWIRRLDKASHRKSFFPCYAYPPLCHACISL